MIKVLLMAVLSSLIFLSPIQSNASIIFSDNFNAENGGNNALGYNAFSNWNVIGYPKYTVDLVGGQAPWNWFPDHGMYIDMDGSSNNAGKIVSKQSFALTPGRYLFSFELAGNQRSSSTDFVIAEVAFGNLVFEQLTLSQTDPFQVFKYYFDVTETTTAQISFTGIGKDNEGMLLDNVNLSSVPVPAAAWLLGSGLIGLVVVKRRTLI